MNSEDKKQTIEQLISQRKEIVDKLGIWGGARDEGMRSTLLETIKSLDKVLTEWAKPASVPFQCCPKCFGDGHLGRYNSPTLCTTATSVCDVCHGSKIIPQYIISSEIK